MFAVVLAVEAAALPVAINIATESLPDGWRPYLWIAWPVVVVATLGLALSGGRNQAAADPPAAAPIQINSSAAGGGTVFGVQGGRQVIHPPPQPQRGPADDDPPCPAGADGGGR